MSVIEQALGGASLLEAVFIMYRRLMLGAFVSCANVSVHQMVRFAN